MGAEGRKGLIGVVETGEGRTPRPEDRPDEICYRHSRHLILVFRVP